MIALVHPEPTSIAALWAIALGFALLSGAVLLARGRTRVSEPDKGGRRDGRSAAGVAIQAAGFAAVGFGPVAVTLDPTTPRALGEAGAVLALMLFTIALFFAASRAMGRNWSIIARTRGDHELVTGGPFAVIRHPIYTGLFAILIAMALAFGHWHGLILGIPLYGLGTWMRVRREEALLRARFGAAYDAYAARVKRFLPGLI